MPETGDRGTEVGAGEVRWVPGAGRADRRAPEAAVGRGRRLTGLAVALLLLGATGIDGQEAGLVAPVYPGAVPAGPAGTYLTRADVAEVKSFYDARLGEGREADGRTMYTVGPGLRADSGKVYWTVFSREEAMAITGEPLNEAMQTTASGVLAEGPAPGSSELVPGEVGHLPVVGGYFEQMERLTRVGTLDRSEIEPVFRRFLPLARMHYRTVRDGEGGSEPYHQLHLRRCAEDGMGGRLLGDARSVDEADLEAMEERYQQLFAEGKLEEAMELQQRMTELAMAGMVQEMAEEDGETMGTISSGETLEVLRACLAELESEAFPTRIRISTHPETWELDRWWERAGP